MVPLVSSYVAIVPAIAVSVLLQSATGWNAALPFGGNGRNGCLSYSVGKVADRCGRMLPALQATAEYSSRADTQGKNAKERNDAVLGLQTEDEAQEWPYDWRKHWYPVGFDLDFPAGEKPFGVSIFDEPLVVYRDGEGALQCVSDTCPHRASRLSEGMVNDGKIECLYHGWQFDGRSGACVHIPQLDAGVSPPRAANLRVYPVDVKEGVVFVWMGEDPWGEGAKDITPVPCTPYNLDENKPSFLYQFTYELPYDWSYLAENLLDPAHIPISHHATVGGGDRDSAGPIDFEVIKRGLDAAGPHGFQTRTTGNSFRKGDKNRMTSRYKFEAPCIVRVGPDKPKFKDDGTPAPVFGAALHTIPLGKGRSRLLFMTYAFNVPRVLGPVLQLKPMALRHLNSCKILEQDMALICAQEDHVARTGQSLSEAFLPLKTSDGNVVEFRKWLDRVGHGMPHFTGWKKSKGSTTSGLSDHEHSRNQGHRSRESRYHRHVVFSECSRKFLRTLVRWKRRGFVWAVVFGAAATVLASGALGSAAAASSTPAFARHGRAAVAAAVACVSSLGIAAGLAQLEGHFHKNFERHPLLI